MSLISPEARLRAGFYLLFTMVGVFHAEVLSRSQPWALVNPFSIAIIFPVYGLHYVVLGDLLIRRRITSLAPVFLCGCLLGLYEFVITKVFWVPYWNPTSGAEVGFAWFEVLWVGFAWHAVMSFTIPFMLMRHVMLPGSPSPGESRPFKAVLVGVPLMTAGFSAAMGDPAYITALSIFASLGIIAAFSYYFARRAPAWGYTGPDDLVLGPLGLRLAVAGLVAVYILFGVSMRTEVVPASFAVLAPVPFYALIIALLYPHLKGAAGGTAPSTTPDPPAERAATLVVAPAAAPWAAARSFLGRYALLFGGSIALSIVLAATVPVVLILLVVVLVYGGTLGGTALLAWSALSSWKVWRKAAAG